MIHKWTNRNRIDNNCVTCTCYNNCLWLIYDFNRKDNGCFKYTCCNKLDNGSMVHDSNKYELKCQKWQRLSHMTTLYSQFIFEHENNSNWKCYQTCKNWSNCNYCTYVCSHTCRILTITIKAQRLQRWWGRYQSMYESCGNSVMVCKHATLREGER